MRVIAKIPFIRKIIQKKALRNWRSFLRAYRIVKQEDKMGRILAVKHLLVKTPCIGKAGFANFFFGAATDKAELVTRQLLNNNLVAYRLNKTLIYATANSRYIIAHPLPKKYRDVLRKEGYNVSGFRSGFLFWWYIWLRFFRGVYDIAVTFAKNCKETITHQQKNLGNYAVFCSLGKKNLPHTGSGKSYDIISWYMQWEGRIHNPDAMVHTVKHVPVIKLGNMPVVARDAVIPHLYGIKKSVQYTAWATAAISVSFVNIFSGKWWNAFMLPEANEAAVVRIQDAKELAKDYLFHPSVWMYRPLWTYDAEKKGARIILYFYSTNIEPTKDKKGYPEPIFGWRIATWPYYLVWDQYQADYIKQFSNAKISVVGPIWFQGGTAPMPQLPINTFAVFDVQPRRDALYALLTMDLDYYTPATNIPFLKDIYTCLHEVGASMVLKRKREIGKVEHAAYTQQVCELEKQKDFIAIDPDLPAQTVVENCKGVISMPFTSTSIIGREFKKPSVYYDPCGLIQKDDKAAHGIPILTGVDELRQWIKEVMETN